MAKDHRVSLQAGSKSAPELEEWLDWPRWRVAEWISENSGPLVVGWPFDGTKRWHLLNSRENPSEEDYVKTLVKRQAEGQRLLFDLGASAILAPCFSYGLLGRGEEYTHDVARAIFEIGKEQSNQRMFESGVRLRFYGDYEEALERPGLSPMLEECHRLMERTAGNRGPLLLLGLFADAPYERIARISVDFSQRRGRPPNRGELVREYYGVDVPYLSLYIGFAQPAVFDVPLLATGKEDLYATLNPSPEVTERQLREILYDHLVLRRAKFSNYENFSPEAVDRLKDYSESSNEQTLGIGRVDQTTGVWNPLPGPSTTYSG